MKPIEIAREVVNSGIMVTRPRKNAPGEYDAKPYFTGNHRGWTAVDAFTASAMCAVYDRLSEAAQAKYDTLSLGRAVDITWKLVS